MGDAPELKYLILKNGMYYRPDSAGYTSTKFEAGRYSLCDAISITHPNGPDGPRDGMRYVHESEVPDSRADLSDAKDVDVVAKMNAASLEENHVHLKDRIAELERMNAELVEAADAMADAATHACDCYGGSAHAALRAALSTYRKVKQ